MRRFKQTGVLISLLLLIGLACRLPGAVTRRAAPEGTRTSTVAIAEGPAAGQESETAGPVQETSPEIQLSPTPPEADPGVVTAAPDATSGAGATVTLSADLAPAEPQPEDSFTPEPGDAAAQPTSGEPAYPGEPPQATQPAANAAEPYPPVQALPSDTPPVQATQPLEQTEPGSQPTGDPTVGAPPLRTQNAATAVFSTSSPVLQTATNTPLPSPTRYFPPTPLPSATPTPTRTLIPAPPWVRVPLKATDPRTVKLASGKVQLVEFFAFWSGPSQAMAPLIQGLEEGYNDEVNFVYLDIDDPAVTEFERELRFRVEPHFFLLDPDGRVFRQWVGYVTVAELQAAIEEALPR